MNREIKFRAYHKKHKTIHQVLSIYGLGYEECNIILKVDENSPQELIQSNGIEGIKEVELMQFTGLKDKNGTEIYEGNLLEHDMEVNGIWDTYEACKVVFDEECGIFCFDWDSPNLLTDYRNLKVVGNVFENKKLLESEG